MARASQQVEFSLHCAVMPKQSYSLLAMRCFISVRHTWPVVKTPAFSGTCTNVHCTGCGKKIWTLYKSYSGFKTHHLENNKNTILSEITWNIHSQKIRKNISPDFPGFRLFPFFIHQVTNDDLWIPESQILWKSVENCSTWVEIFSLTVY